MSSSSATGSSAAGSSALGSGSAHSVGWAARGSTGSGSGMGGSGGGGGGAASSTGGAAAARAGKSGCSRQEIHSESATMTKAPAVTTTIQSGRRSAA